MAAAYAILAAALRDTSLREVAGRAGISRRSVQGLLEGHVPSIDRAEQICAALGWELYIGPPRALGAPCSQDSEPQPKGDGEGARSSGNVVPGSQIQLPLTKFSWRLTLPVREWAHCSPEGYLSLPRQIGQAPAPVDLLDNEAFYGQMMGQSMLPEGIGGFGFYALISPNTPLDLDERVWLSNAQGVQVVRRLVAVDGEAYSLRGWRPPGEHGDQEPINEQWMRADVEAVGVVLAVYASWPSVKRPPFLVPDVAPSKGRRFACRSRTNVWARCWSPWPSTTTTSTSTAASSSSPTCSTTSPC